MTFSNRQEAGEKLAEKLSSYRSAPHTIVVGLTRGGVIVAERIAKKLCLPLDALVVKKIPHPNERELAIGALAPDGVSYLDHRLIQLFGIDKVFVKDETDRLGEEIRNKTALYRKKRPPFNVKDKTVILVDDGVATGATLEVAVRWLKKKKAYKIVAAIPVMSPDTMSKIEPEVEKLIVLKTPQDFHAVGQFYSNFPQISDEEVIEQLQNKSKKT